MRRVRVSLSIDVEVPGLPDDDVARSIAQAYITDWLNRGLPEPPFGVHVDLRHARMGHVWKT